MRLLKLPILFFFVLSSSLGLVGQGFEQIFGGNLADIGEALVATENGGYVLAGYSESFGADNDLDIYVVRTDVEGEQMWSQVYDEGFDERGYAIIATEDNGFLIAGERRITPTSTLQAYVIKIDANGNLMWSQNYGSEEHHEQAFAVSPSLNGGYIILGRSEEIATNDRNIYVAEIDATGNLLWEKTYGDTEPQEGNDISIFKDSYVIVGKTRSMVTLSSDAYILRIDARGEIIWEQSLGGHELDQAKAVVVTSEEEIVFAGSTGNSSNVYLAKLDSNGEEIWSRSFGGLFGDIATDLIQLPTGEFILAGITERTAANIDIFLTKASSSGNVIWERFIGSPELTEYEPSLVNNGEGFALYASNSDPESVFLTDAFLVATDVEGNLNSNYIRGTVAIDNNASCIYEESVDEGLEGWLVKAVSEDKTYFGTTNINGRYEMLIDTGSYHVSVVTQNDYWQACIDDYNPQVFGFYDSLQLNFPIKANIACPFMQVDIGTTSLSDCDNVIYQLEYCNTGTKTASNAYVEVSIDDLVAINGTSIPVSSVIDNIYRFEVGNVGVGQCGSFSIDAIMDCEGYVTGQALMASAHIFPDMICTPVDSSWDGSSVRIKGECEADSVTFSLKNIGTGSMEDSLQYFVFEDIILLGKDSFRLAPSQELEVSYPAEGQTYRMVAKQSEGHPGQSYPTVVIEGCANENAEIISTGFVTAFPEDEGNPFISIDIQENTEFTEAVQMRAYPRGYGERHIVPEGTKLEYQIRFQNLSTDTVNSVTIRDTLSSALDLATIQPGASSHPYFFEVYGDGVVKFTFFDLHLAPNSSAASQQQGFVNFKISPVPGHPMNVNIENRAAVYLNYDAPVVTNTVFHTIGSEDITDYVEISTSTKDVFVEGVEIKVYPNPFVEATTMEIDGINVHEGLLEIYDMNGKMVRHQPFSGNQVRVQKGGLTSGIYFYHLSGDQRRLNSGKIFVQ